MAKQFLGQVRPLYKGEWAADMANKPLDLVLYEGELYVCIASRSTDNPSANTEFFKLVVPQGLPGVTSDHEWDGTRLSSDGIEAVDLRGPQGPKGPIGEIGAPGLNGSTGPMGSCGATKVPDHQWRLHRGTGNRHGHAAAWKLAEIRLGSRENNVWGPWRNLAGNSGNAT